MKSTNSTIGYHLVAFLTVAIWGSTFVFTKILLQNGLSPAQIFTLRFIIAYVLLFGYELIFKYNSFRLFSDSWKDELLMVLLGVTGGSVYFLTENAAMLFTTRSYRYSVLDLLVWVWQSLYSMVISYCTCLH